MLFLIIMFTRGLHLHCSLQETMNIFRLDISTPLPYLHPAESSSYPQTLYFWGPFQYYSTATRRYIIQPVFSLRVFRLKCCNHFLLPSGLLSPSFVPSSSIWWPFFNFLQPLTDSQHHQSVFFLLRERTMSTANPKKQNLYTAAYIWACVKKVR